MKAWTFFPPRVIVSHSTTPGVGILTKTLQQLLHQTITKKRLQNSQTSLVYTTPWSTTCCSVHYHPHRAKAPNPPTLQLNLGEARTDHQIGIPALLWEPSLSCEPQPAPGCLLASALAFQHKHIGFQGLLWVSAAEGVGKHQEFDKMRKMQGKKKKEEGFRCLPPHRAAMSGIVPARSAAEPFMMNVSQLEWQAQVGAAEVAQDGALWCSEATSITYCKPAVCPCPHQRYSSHRVSGKKLGVRRSLLCQMVWAEQLLWE